jgi:hypothetical protein
MGDVAQGKAYLHDVYKAPASYCSHRANPKGRLSASDPDIADCSA